MNEVLNHHELVPLMNQSPQIPMNLHLIVMTELAVAAAVVAVAAVAVMVEYHSVRF